MISILYEYSQQSLNTHNAWLRMKMNLSNILGKSVIKYKETIT